MRAFRIANTQNRDAEIELSTSKITKEVIYLTANKEPVKTKRIVKNTTETSSVRLLQRFSDPSQLAEALIQGDPEIDFNHIGRFFRTNNKGICESRF